MRLLIKLIFLSAILGGVIYSIHRLKTHGIRPEYLFVDQSVPQSFAENDVSHFEWRAQDKIFSYDKTPSGQWQPERNKKTLFRLLQFLSQIQLNDVQQTAKPVLEVVLKIKDQVWRGGWDGLSFVWSEGPQKGHGEILSDKKNRVFFRGKFIFDDISLDLCSTRVTEILLRNGGKNYDIVQSGKEWTSKDPSQKVDSVAVEKWLTQICKVKIRAVVDPAYNPSKENLGALSLRYVDGKQLNLTHVEADFFLLGEWALILDGMAKELESFQKAVTGPANP